LLTLSFFISIKQALDGRIIVDNGWTRPSGCLVPTSVAPTQQVGALEGSEMRVSATCSTNARFQFRKLHKFFFPTLRQYCLCHRFDTQLTLPRRCFINTGARRVLSVRSARCICAFLCAIRIYSVHTCTHAHTVCQALSRVPCHFPSSAVSSGEVKMLEFGAGF
jgi:hypothetical protein